MALRTTLLECLEFLKKCESSGAPGAIGECRKGLEAELNKTSNPERLRKSAEKILMDFNMLAPKFRNYNFQEFISKLNKDLDPA